MRYVAAPLSLGPNCSLQQSYRYRGNHLRSTSACCRRASVQAPALVASAANVEEDPLSLLMRTRPPWGQQYVALCFLQVLIGNLGGESGYPGIELT